MRARRFFVASVTTALVVLGIATPDDVDARGPTCPAGMVLVDPAVVVSDTPPKVDRPFCVDRYEAGLVLVDKEGDHPFSPYETIQGRHVRAVSRPGVVPQAYVSRNEADLACKASHKRLCVEPEWTTACRGKRPTQFPYGDDKKDGYCNDSGVSPLQTLYANAPDAHENAAMNDPRLNALPGTLAKTGAHPHCKSSWGTFDMVGNVHEWVDDPGGTFLGGYYLDTHINGDGCAYKTVAHDATYHDYSTGFRCCADVKGH